MNILTKAYLDRNFGDDMMLRIIADRLKEHSFFLEDRRKEVFIPFMAAENIHDRDDHPGVKMDFALKVTGSGFMIADKVAIYYALADFFTSLFSGGKKKLLSAVIGCNVGPFANRLAERLAISNMRQYTLFSVRDRFSYGFIQTKLKNKGIFCFPDILFSLPDSWLPEKTGEDLLGISAYRRRTQNNLAGYKKLAELADAYIEDTQKKVLLFAFDIEEENDLAAAVTIRELCVNKDRVEIIVHSDNGDTVIKNMARCGKFVAVRFHSGVLAMRMGVAFVPLIYSDKTDHMLDDIGFSGKRFYLKDDFSPRELFSELREAKPFALDDAVKNAAAGHAELIREILFNAER